MPRRWEGEAGNAQRSLHRTSGLFNTGGPGGSSECTSLPPAPSSAAYLEGSELPLEFGNYGNDLDFHDLGLAFDDPLGDASLDSFTDLSAFLSEAAFDLEPEAMPPQDNPKSTLVELEATSDLAILSAKVGLKVNPKVTEVKVTEVNAEDVNADHDYSAKRPRMESTTVFVDGAPEDEVFYPPQTPLLTTDISAIKPDPIMPCTSATTSISRLSSTSSSVASTSEDKYRMRREKNNFASKRSRETRKRKFVDMEGEAETLVVDNARLEARIVQLESLAKRMQKILVAKMSGK